MGINVKLKKISIILLATLFSLFLIIEVGLRLSGAIDFPLYTIDDNGHYSLSASQQGSFLNKNDWYVNSRGFNNKAEINLNEPYVMLIGDSVVYGGNPVNYDDRIGTKLSELLRKNVYVGAVGGWSLFNEMEFIDKNIDVASKADYIFIQYDYGDLWDFAKDFDKNSTTHPSSRPISATYYYLEKIVYPKILKINQKSELPQISNEIKRNGPWEKDLLNISNRLNKKIIFVLYPGQDSFQDSSMWSQQTKDIKEFINNNKDKFDYIDIAKSKKWNTNLYRDGIHPNPAGNLVVAEEISKYITYN